MRGGVSSYYCGGIWYRPAYQGTTVIYIVEEKQAMQSQELSRDARVRGILTKPLNIDRLLATVKEAGVL